MLASKLKTEYELTVCVATEYGEILLAGETGFTVRSGRMDGPEMERFFTENGFVRAVDATHPFAFEATENIRDACEKTGVEYLRVLRESGDKCKAAVYVGSVAEAADYLKGKEGNILVTTGSKEISLYSQLPPERIWARVLPGAESISLCLAANIAPGHIIAAQGPFTKEFNAATLKMINAKYMVLKDSGRTGGTDEKLAAARECGVVPVVVGRPPQEKGVSPREALKILLPGEKPEKTKVYIIGTGPSGENDLTLRAKNALEESKLVFGAESVTSFVPAEKRVINEFLPEKVASALAKAECAAAAVLVRGDPGFYSGAKKLARALTDCEVEIIPGVSSVSAFAAKIQKSWDDARLISLHGRNGNIVSAVRESKKVFALTGGENTVKSVCRRLCDCGLGGVFVSVGERLGYADERIASGTAEGFAETDFDPLSIVYVENPSAAAGISVGLPDSAFIRGDVPMTKSEIRAVTLSKLSPQRDSVVWDVGAGTGSVSVECALNSPLGAVYAVERDEAACELIDKNKAAFGLENLFTVRGEAPGALLALPAPTHVFIGGSGGNLREIINCALDKNPRAVIVLNAVTLNTLCEAAEIKDSLSLSFECVQINAASTRRAGKYDLMSAHNPVFIITFKGQTNA